MTHEQAITFLRAFLDGALDFYARRAARLAAGYPVISGFFRRPGAPGAYLRWADLQHERAELTEAGREFVLAG